MQRPFSRGNRVLNILSSTVAKAIFNLEHCCVWCYIQICTQYTWHAHRRSRRHCTVVFELWDQTVCAPTSPLYCLAFWNPVWALRSPLTSVFLSVKGVGCICFWELSEGLSKRRWWNAWQIPNGNDGRVFSLAAFLGASLPMSFSPIEREEEARVYTFLPQLFGRTRVGLVGIQSYGFAQRCCHLQSLCWRTVRKLSKVSHNILS